MLLAIFWFLSAKSKSNCFKDKATTNRYVCSPKILEEKLSQILTQDIGLGDVTASAVIPRECKLKPK
jgi:hypothetical protein